MRKNTVEDFWKKVQKTESCWVWTGKVKVDGYGRLHFKNKRMLAHRLSFELANGPVPGGLHVLHHCDNRPCVNPDHLFLGTNKDNVDDKMSKGRHYSARQTHCKRGHPLDGENLYIRPEGARGCRACREDRVNRWRSRHPDKAAAVFRKWETKNRAKRNAYRRELNRKLAESKPKLGNANARKTHCKFGHEYTPENTSFSKGASGLQRVCRLCRSDYQRRLRSEHASKEDLDRLSAKTTSGSTP